MDTVKTPKDRRFLEIIDAIVLKGKEKSPRQILVRINENESLINKVRKGIQSIQDDVITKLVANYGINRKFVDYGEGAKFLEDQPVVESPEELLKELERLRKENLDLKDEVINLYREMNKMKKGE